jgi:hypothetical protein
MQELRMQLLWRYVSMLQFLPIKTLDKAGIYLKANPLEPNKDSQIDDVLSNPETFGREEESNQSGSTYSKHS